MKYGQLTTNFHIDEFRCNDANKTAVPLEHILNCLLLAQNLQVLRDYLNSVITINSGYRTPEYNDLINGADKSKHKEALAADIVAKGYTPKKVADAIEYLISIGKMTEGGIGRYKTFTHYDPRGTKSRWGRN